MVSTYINALVDYGIRAGLTPECERIYTTNLLLDLMQEDGLEDVDVSADASENNLKDNLEAILEGLLQIAVEKKLIPDSITYKDLFDTKLMNCLLPRPAEVQREFDERYAVSPKLATDWFYQFSQDNNYIRTYRVKKDKKWKVDSEYGEIDITINLSKPEKDPLAIAAAKNAKNTSYPKCQLCVENEGYAGRADHPARENHRIIPLIINNSDWCFQYSPYVYYNEHCIVFNREHTPMKIDRAAFQKLFDFVSQFPHYMLGSNADLPIVGGSILSHDHFQGGNYTFPMAKAKMEIMSTIPNFEDVECGILNWPMSVIRIRHRDYNRLIDFAEHILNKWRAYTDEDAFIYAYTDGVPHNTITPIARKVADTYELDLVLRNNITTEEHPLGVYHPHTKLHHIKKENIGLIEVMGLAVLPARLNTEMALLKEAILSGADMHKDPVLEKHADWVEEFLPQYEDINFKNIDEIIEKEIGKVFVQVLDDAGVYKHTIGGRVAFLKFMNSL